MPYAPKYTSEDLVEALLQTTIDNSTIPTSSQLLTWIEEVEKKMDADLLGSYTATDELNDVETVNDQEVFKPKFTPILTVTNLYRNKAALHDAVDYELLTEGPGDSTHFVILKAVVCGKLVGYALYIYDRHPGIGRNKVKITYTYGYNIDSKVLQEYATKKVALQVLEVWAASTAKAIDLKAGPWAPLLRFTQRANPRVGGMAS